MSEWKVYSGTDEQLAEMRNAEHGFILRDINSVEFDLIYYVEMYKDESYFKQHLIKGDVKQYFICNPHPLADMIKRWADTGQIVYIKYIDEQTDELVMYATDKPDWNIEGAEYSFTPFSEE